MKPAFTLSRGIPFSCLRDCETRTSWISSHSALCFLRSITAAVLRPLSSVMNCIPLMKPASPYWDRPCLSPYAFGMFPSTIKSYSVIGHVQLFGARPDGLMKQLTCLPERVARPNCRRCTPRFPIRHPVRLNRRKSALESWNSAVRCAEKNGVCPQWRLKGWRTAPAPSSSAHPVLGLTTPKGALRFDGTPLYDVTRTLIIAGRLATHITAQRMNRH